MGAENIDTKTRIFDAADELFCKFGYDGVSVRDIARCADVNKASVFYYFSSKEELFEAVLSRYYDLHRGALEGALISEGTVRDQMHRLIDDYWAFMQDNARYSKLVQGLLVTGGERLAFAKHTLAPLFNWTMEVLAEISPEKGPKAARQMYLTFVSAVVNYFTYSPALEDVWGDEPFSEASMEERRAHLHWLVDLVLDDLVDAAD
ncbi:MAG: TetR/AcrR family transcriptional regulator [Persicimonas sp.]